MRAMSVIGILVSAIGLYFGMSFMMAGATDTETGIGFIDFCINGYFLAFSIVGVVKTKRR